ncbi:hypothetical protein D3C85_238810 [compost metagenome]
MSTVQTVAVTVAVGAVAIAGYKYYQRKRAERIMKKALGEFADELEKVFGTAGFAGEGGSNFSWKRG